VARVKQTLSAIVHGATKVGKSTLASTAPVPILVLDAEGSWTFLPVRMVTWDPMRYAPPVYDGTWEACVVNVRDWGTLVKVYEWLTQYPQHCPFVSVVWDSVSEIQTKCKDNLQGTEAMRIQDWGALLDVMMRMIKAFRDMIREDWSAARVLILTAETKMQDGKWTPYMQGQIGIRMPYWVDLIGYLFVDFEGDENGQPTRQVRKLLVGPHPQFVTGERVQGRLGNIVIMNTLDPTKLERGRDVERMLSLIFPSLPTPEPQAQEVPS
jgi:AAA domain